MNLNIRLTTATNHHKIPTSTLRHKRKFQKRWVVEMSVWKGLQNHQTTAWDIYMENCVEWWNWPASQRLSKRAATTHPGSHKRSQQNIQRNVGLSAEDRVDGFPQKERDVKNSFREGVASDMIIIPTIKCTGCSVVVWRCSGLIMGGMDLKEESSVTCPGADQKGRPQSFRVVWSLSCLEPSRDAVVELKQFILKNVQKYLSLQRAGFTSFTVVIKLEEALGCSYCCRIGGTCNYILKSQLLYSHGWFDDMIFWLLYLK